MKKWWLLFLLLTVLPWSGCSTAPLRACGTQPAQLERAGWTVSLVGENY
jgi:hypothetical protein